MAKLVELEEYVKRRIQDEKINHTALSMELKGMFPGQSGLSVRSIQWFCEAKDIRKTSRLSQESVEAVVREAIIRVILKLPNFSVPKYCLFRFGKGRTNVWAQNDARTSRIRRRESF